MTEMMTTFIVFFSLTQRIKFYLLKKALVIQPIKRLVSIFDVFEQKNKFSFAYVMNLV